MVLINLSDQNKSHSHLDLIVFTSIERNIFQIVLSGAAVNTPLKTQWRRAYLPWLFERTDREDC